jgi:hypothetical protein
MPRFHPSTPDCTRDQDADHPNDPHLKDFNLADVRKSNGGIVIPPKHLNFRVPMESDDDQFIRACHRLHFGAAAHNLPSLRRIATKISDFVADRNSASARDAPRASSVGNFIAST